MAAGGSSPWARPLLIRFQLREEFLELGVCAERSEGGILPQPGGVREALVDGVPQQLHRLVAVELLRRGFGIVVEVVVLVDDRDAPAQNAGGVVGISGRIPADIGGGCGSLANRNTIAPLIAIVQKSLGILCTNTQSAT